MAYQRVELHNHTTESDGSMTVEEYVQYATERNFQWTTVTDHNTCSGIDKAKQIVNESNLDLKIIGGFELTTFYGHILILGTKEMIPFEKLDPENPEKFLSSIKNNGKSRVVGIAHPFCVGEPFTIGCRCSLNITDWTCVDYIEIFNTSAGDNQMGNIFIGNEQALALWKKLVLKGYKLAAVTGKDTHRPQKVEPVFCTYIYGNTAADTSEDAERKVIEAIQNQRTIVTKGPYFSCYEENDGIYIFFDHTSQYFDWNKKCRQMEMILQVTESSGHTRKWNITADTKKIKIAEYMKESVVAEIFLNECTFSNLLAIAVFNGGNTQ